MSNLICKQCGAELSENSKFCTACGASVNSEDKNQGTIQNPVAVPQPQAQAQSQQYYQPQPPTDLEKPLSVGGWLVTMIVTSIPFIGVIMMFVWAFTEGNKGRRNYMRACLIMAVIGVVLTIIIAVLFGTVLASLFAELEYSNAFTY